MLLLWHVKDPSFSAKSAGGRLHLNMPTPLTQQSWSGLTMPLSKLNVGMYPEMRSQTTCQGTLAELLWTDPGQKSGISVQELISTSKKKRKKETDKSAGGQ